QSWRTRARSQGARGESGGEGTVSSRYSRVATDSAGQRPATQRAGTWARGVRARGPGGGCSAGRGSAGAAAAGAPLTARARRTVVDAALAHGRGRARVRALRGARARHGRGRAAARAGNVRGLPGGPAERAPPREPFARTGAVSGDRHARAGGRRDVPGR